MNRQNGKNGDAHVTLSLILESALRYEWARCIHLQLILTLAASILEVLCSVQFFASDSSLTTNPMRVQKRQSHSISGGPSRAGNR